SPRTIIGPILQYRGTSPRSIGLIRPYFGASDSLYRATAADQIATSVPDQLARSRDAPSGSEAANSGHRESAMSADEIRYRIKEAVSRIAGISVDRISDDARFTEDLGLDSLSIIESLVVVEHEFRLQPQQEDMETRVKCIEDAVQLVQSE